MTRQREESGKWKEKNIFLLPLFTFLSLSCHNMKIAFLYPQYGAWSRSIPLLQCILVHRIVKMWMKMHLRSVEDTLESPCFIIYPHSYELRSCISSQRLAEEARHDVCRRFPRGLFQVYRGRSRRCCQARKGKRPRHNASVRSLRIFYD